MSEENKARTREFYDAVNRNDLSIIDTHVTDDFVEYEELPGLPPGKEGVRAFFSLMHGAFSGFQIKVDELIAEGDRVVARGFLTGTHTGEFMGIPASNREINVPVIDIMGIRDGKAYAHWGVTDSGLMMMQLGAIPQA